MDLAGAKIKVKVAVNETTGKISYRTATKGKDKEGKDIWKSRFINLVQDAKNKPIDNDTFITITKGFDTFEEKDRGTEWRIVVQDFEYNDIPTGAKTADFTYSEEDDELPF